MRGLLTALLLLLPALSQAQTLVSPPPPPLPTSSGPQGEVRYVAPRPAQAPQPPPPPPVQYVAPRPADTPVAPPPPALPQARPIAPPPAVPAAAPAHAPLVAPPPPQLPFVQAREVGTVPPPPPPEVKQIVVVPQSEPASRPAQASPSVEAAVPAAEPTGTRIISATSAPPASAPATSAAEPVADLDVSPTTPVEEEEPAPTAAAAPSSSPEKAQAAQAQAEKKEEEEEEVDTDALHGELSSVGMSRMVSRTNRVLVSAGYNRIGKGQYALVYPQVGLAMGDFSLGLGVPLNFEIFNSAYPKDPGPGDNHVIGFNNAGSLRKEDWDEVSEYARVLTYLTYGKKEDSVYLDIGQRHTSTLGHGPIMRRYASNTDVNLTRVGLQFDAHTDALGFEFMTNDVMRWNIIGGLAFVRPLALFGAGKGIGKLISIGVTAAVDREAPTRLVMMPEPACPVPGACGAANVPSVDDRNRLEAERAVVALGGLDVELDLLRTRHASIKPYVDYSRLFYSGPEGEGGGGLMVGVLGRFAGGLVLKHGLRLVAEYRRLGEGYVPSYFDSFYEVDKYLSGGTGGVKPGEGQVPMTKLQATVGAGRPAARNGYYLEASYGIEDALGLTLALEGQSEDPAKNFIAHLEVPALSFLQFFASLYKRGFTDMSTIFDLDSSAVAFAGARLKVLPILFLSGRAFKTFELDAFKGANGPLGSLQYRNAWGWAGDLELGFEF